MPVKFVERLGSARSDAGDEAGLSGTAGRHSRMADFRFQLRVGELR